MRHKADSWLADLWFTQIAACAARGCEPCRAILKLLAKHD